MRNTSYQKLKQKNKVKKAKIQVLLAIVVIIGLNYGINYLQETTLFDTKTVKIDLGREKDAETVNDTPSVEKWLESQKLTLEEKIEKTFPEEPREMTAIAKSESGLNPKAVNINRNGTKDIGIFQINSIHGYDEEWLKNPDNNLIAAREVYEKQGKGAWVVYNMGYYKENL